MKKLKRNRWMKNKGATILVTAVLPHRGGEEAVNEEKYTWYFSS